MTEVIETIMQNGLRKYKVKNSKMRLLTSESEGNKGAIFAYRSKESMIEGIGLVLTSEESILENEDKFSHFTPNIFRYGTYADPDRLFTKGHREDNLRQINTFFLDIDTLDPKFNYGEMILACHEFGYPPTMVLKSPRGYQVFFVLKKAAYVTKKSNYKVIECAKRISNNLRAHFKKQGFPIDFNANHFGITRMPSHDNLLFFDLFSKS